MADRHRESFTREELALPYDQWEKIVREKAERLHPDAARWLRDWNMQDVMYPPVSDDVRPHVRTGHYTGWFDGLLAERRRSTNEAINRMNKRSDKREI